MYTIHFIPHNKNLEPRMILSESPLSDLLDINQNVCFLEAYNIEIQMCTSTNPEIQAMLKKLHKSVNLDNFIEYLRKDQTPQRS